MKPISGSALEGGAAPPNQEQIVCINFPSLSNVHKLKKLRVFSYSEDWAQLGLIVPHPRAECVFKGRTVSSLPTEEQYWDKILSKSTVALGCDCSGPPSRKTI